MAERVDLDFSRARRREFFGRLSRRFGGSVGASLLDFDVEKGKAASVRPVGRRVVETARIVGSVGRSRDFDGSFMPKTAKLRKKWERVDRGFLSGEAESPVSLYQVGEKYFVGDGNFRVSVARFHGVEMLDAEVVEYGSLSEKPRPQKTAAKT